MKIVEYKSRWPKRIMCQVCNTVLEYDAEDLETKTSVSIVPMGTTGIPCSLPILGITCPSCKNWIKLS